MRYGNGTRTFDKTRIEDSSFTKHTRTEIELRPGFGFSGSGPTPERSQHCCSEQLVLTTVLFSLQNKLKEVPACNEPQGWQLQVISFRMDDENILLMKKMRYYTPRGFLPHLSSHKYNEFITEHKI